MSVVRNNTPKRVTFEVQFLWLHIDSNICGWQSILWALLNKVGIWTNAKKITWCGLHTAKLYCFKVRKYLWLTRPCGWHTCYQFAVNSTTLSIHREVISYFFVINETVVMLDKQNLWMTPLNCKNLWLTGNHPKN